MRTGRVFDIKRYALHDGPGIRTTVFLSGCPLRCAWCHNPESMSFQQQFQWQADRCIACDLCVEACEQSALTRDHDGQSRESAACVRCLACVDVCPTAASEVVGRDYSVDELVREIERDRPFYEQSGGGMTLSGGEPLMQAAFAVDLLERCGQRGLHRAVDTSGHAPTLDLMRVAEHTDLFLYDVKHLDDDAHRRVTGVSNGLILDNLYHLACTDVDIEIRVPVVPGMNDELANARATADFLLSLPRPLPVRLLAYHAMGRHKYERCGIPNAMPPDTPPPSSDDLSSIAQCFVDRGVTVLNAADQSATNTSDPTSASPT